jgi:neutral ceramidase
MTILCVAACLWVSRPIPAARAIAGELLAGTARVDITPPVGFAMGGYSARQGVSQGVNDRLSATVLVLKTPTESLAIITADVVALYSPRVEAEVEKRFGIRNVLLSASHTHSGPAMPLGPAAATAPEPMREWWRRTEDSMIEAVGIANRELFPARLGGATGLAHVHHNRRQVMPDGTARMFWRNAEKLPTSPVDPTVSVLRVDDTSGKTRAVLVSFSCHPTVLGPDNLMISRDYVGVMVDYIEARVPGATAVYMFGASGDINPYFDKQPFDQQPFEHVRWTGETVGEVVVQTVARIQVDPPVSEAIRYSAEVHEFAHRWNPGENVPVAMAVVLLNGKYGFVAVTADPFIEHQMRLRDQSPLPVTFMVAHASFHGTAYGRYLPTIRAAGEGGYGATYATAAEVGAGEALVVRALVRLLEFMGKLRQVPDM